MVIGGGADGFAGFKPPPVVLWTLEPILEVSGEANFGALPPPGVTGVVEDLAAEDSKLRGKVLRERVDRGNFPAAAVGGGGEGPGGPLPPGPEPPV